jgi:threonine synthase
MRREASPVSTTLTNAASSTIPSSFGFATNLACRECGHTCPLGSTHVCDQCFGPLEVAYNLPPLTREHIESGPLSMWRYASLLPVRPDIASTPNLDPGWTRLVRADQLASILGMRELWIKDERGNPTHSFKDRVVVSRSRPRSSSASRCLPARRPATWRMRWPRPPPAPASAPSS